jgi:WhiB family transcriptional regulator, redox-sensing transcriptional regulator
MSRAFGQMDSINFIEEDTFASGQAREKFIADLRSRTDEIERVRKEGQAVIAASKKPEPKQDNTSLEWKQRGACNGLDPAIMYPNRGDTLGSRKAKAICGGCVVRGMCLEYSMSNGEKFGIWGGMSERERRLLRRRRALLEGASKLATSEAFVPDAAQERAG